LLFAVIAFVAQVRGARLAAALAVPAAAWVILLAREAYLRRVSVRSVAGLVMAWLSFAGIPIMMVANLLVPQPAGSDLPANAANSPAACKLPAAFITLGEMPPSRIMSFVDLGSHVLAYTHHSVVGAPYHRNQAGLLDTFRFFNGPPGAAREIARKRGLDLVVICPFMTEMGGVGTTEPDALLNRFGNGDLPDWLTEIPQKDSALRVFRINSDPDTALSAQ